MSHRAINWTWEQDLTPTHKMVLLALADMSDEHESCFPGVERLAKMAGVSTRTVLRAIETLVEKSLVVVERRNNADGHRTSNRYYLQVPGRDEPRRQSVTKADGLSDIHDAANVTSGEIAPLIEPPVEEPLQMICNPPQDFSDEVKGLAQRLATIVVQNEHKVPADLSGWYPWVDKLIRIDGEEVPTVAYVIDWLGRDSFWGINIRSARKLRDQFTVLKATIKKQKADAAKKPPSERPTTTRRITGYDDGGIES